jgi:hypothetical protein
MSHTKERPPAKTGYRLTADNCFCCHPKVGFNAVAQMNIAGLALYVKPLDGTFSWAKYERGYTKNDPPKLVV